MNRRRSRARNGLSGALLAVLAGSSLGCTPPSRMEVTPLPARPAEELTPSPLVTSRVAGGRDSASRLSRDASPLAAGHGDLEPRVSLDAMNADVRTVLQALARQGGVNIVLGPEVKGRVSVSLHDVSVSEALQAVMQEAGLQVLGNTGIQVPWPPVVVFYQLPVNIDELDLIGIQKRFGVSREIAETIMQGRAAMAPR